jgi:glutamate-1-semialdehyde 2,1-aminomutase
MGLALNKSLALYNRAMEIIPTGTQTFSKGRFCYPSGMPRYIERGKGSHVWDVDGNEYIDFVAGLCPIILGYCDPDVDNAVREQMDKGVIFSLPHSLEVEVSELLCEVIPCAEMVRFGKNGSDATSGAIRLARAYTGRDHIAQYGYHGWQDWCNGITQRNAGVPSVIRELTHPFEYNNIDSLHAIFKQYPNQVACVIMEPMSLEWPKTGFLEAVKELSHKNGAVLIFDEMITGFRMALGGAQEYFGVVPDLACFGKAIANGYPLSAIVGKADIMNYFDRVHFSFTNGGECLSLAAAKATIEKLRTDSLLIDIGMSGLKIENGILDLNDKNEYCFHVLGYPSRTQIQFPSDDKKWLFMQLCAERGILTMGVHNMMYAHSDEDIKKLLSVYDEVFPMLDKMEFTGEPPISNFRIR